MRMGNEAHGKLIRLAVYAVVVTLLALWISPVVFQGGKALAEVSLGRPMIRPVAWFADWAGEAGFHEFFVLTFLGFSLLLLPLLADRLGASLWLERALCFGNRHWRVARSGALGFLLVIVAVGLLGLLRGMERDAAGWARLFVKAFALALVFEWVFRGVLFGLLEKRWRPVVVVAVSAAAFAGFRMVLPPPDFVYADPESWSLGWQMLAKLPGSVFSGGFPLLLFAGWGVLLGILRLRDESLWSPVFLHAGWLVALGLSGSQNDAWISWGALCAGFAWLVFVRREHVTCGADGSPLAGKDGAGACFLMGFGAHRAPLQGGSGAHGAPLQAGFSRTAGMGIRKIERVAGRVLGPTLDVLYPSRCELCEIALSGGRALCEDCDAALPRLDEPFCSHCGQPFFGMLDGGIECPNCHGKKLGFQFARPVLRRCDESMDLVHRLKYQRQAHVARELGRIAAEALDDPRFARAREERWALVPVPLHRVRQYHRQFNQAAEIARAMGHATGLPVCHALRRVKATQTQTALHRKERFANLKGAFEVTRAGVRLAESRPRGVILLDDVLTTGSTLGTCARVLRKAGCKRVVAVAVVRG